MSHCSSDTTQPRRKCFNTAPRYPLWAADAESVPWGMDSLKLFEAALGLTAPWKVDAISFDPKAEGPGTIEIRLSFPVTERGMTMEGGVFCAPMAHPIRHERTHRNGARRIRGQGEAPARAADREEDRTTAPHRIAARRALHNGRMAEVLEGRVGTRVLDPRRTTAAPSRAADDFLAVVGACLP